MRHMPLIIQALGRQRQADLCEFEVSLVCRVSSRKAAQCYTKKPCLENPKLKKKKSLVQEVRQLRKSNTVRSKGAVSKITAGYSVASIIHSCTIRKLLERKSVLSNLLSTG